MTTNKVDDDIDTIESMLLSPDTLNRMETKEMLKFYELLLKKKEIESGLSMYNRVFAKG